MSFLQIPYVQQVGETHCGVACLEMVYKYFGIVDRKQEDIWERRKTKRPDGTNFFMLTKSMVEDLIDHDLQILWGHMCLEEEKCRESLEEVFRKRLPLIACKQWDKNPLYGHFVVLIGLEKDEVMYLDPEIGPTRQRKKISDFINEWQKTGKEVTGGVFIVMQKDSKKLQLDHFHAKRTRTY
jgi:ABC-type bacteriocin/lantibiotic exporter with double-glycine peptidase domain